MIFADWVAVPLGVGVACLCYAAILMRRAMRLLYSIALLTGQIHAIDRIEHAIEAALAALPHGKDD